MASGPDVHSKTLDTLQQGTTRLGLPVLATPELFIYQTHRFEKHDLHPPKTAVSTLTSAAASNSILKLGVCLAHALVSAIIQRPVSTVQSFQWRIVCHLLGSYKASQDRRWPI